MKVSKNGTDFFDIDDSDDSVAAAKAKGYQEYIPMTKNGKDVFNVLATDDSYKAAAQKGYQDADMYSFQHKDAKAPEVGTAAAAARGVAQGATGNLADEAYGVLGAVVNPTNSDKGFADRYRDSRDYARGVDKAAAEQHPVANFAGNIAGGIGSAALIPGAATLKGAAALGAVGGLGGSEADLTKGEVGKTALDTAEGAGLGMAGYGVGKALPTVAKGVVSPRETLQAMARGANSGAAAAAEGLENVPVVGKGAALLGAIKGAFGELGETGAVKKEFGAVANDAREALKASVPPEDLAALGDQARQELTNQVKSGGLNVRRLQDLRAFGNGKSVGEMSDDEAVLAALMSDGDNAVKKWVAEKAATAQPGQIDADAYQKVLSHGADARTAAREFDPKEAAKGLKPVVEDVQDLFKNSRNARYGQLQDAARQSFDTAHGTPVLGDLESAISDAESLKSIPSSTRGILDDVKGMLTEGKGTKLQKLTPGAWEEVEPGEQFNRLQQARQLLDQQIKWTNREGHGQAESILRGLRDSVDQALKTSPEKVEGDALYRSSKDLEGRFFGATEFRNPSGGIDVDEGKISKLLGNTDQANRFKAAIGDLKEYAKNPDLAPEFRQKAADLADQLESHIGTMDTKRSIGALRQANGPSSPAIERLGSAAKGNGLLQDAVQSPAGFTNQLDQFNKVLKSKLGKGFQQLDDRDKAGAVKFMVWLKNNPDASQATQEATFARLLSK